MLRFQLSVHRSPKHATYGRRTENSLRMQTLPQTVKTLLYSAAKARRYFRNKVLEIQKFHEIFLDSHAIYSQTKITDTTYGFFPSGATAMLCDFFFFFKYNWILKKYQLMQICGKHSTQSSAQTLQRSLLSKQLSL